MSWAWRKVKVAILYRVRVVCSSRSSLFVGTWKELLGRLLSGSHAVKET